MKLIDGIKQIGKPFEIPDCSRDDLPDFFKQMGYKVGAEIGVDIGDYTEKLSQAGLTVYAIDPYLKYEHYKPYNQVEFDLLYEQTRKRLAPYPNCTIIRKTSMEAAKDIPDESLDFVYIDGNHEFRYVAEDIAEWSKKVRSGGVIAGHDYIYATWVCHVIYVVHAYIQAHKIDNWYLLGRKKAPEGEKRDRYRSFMWIKP